MKSITTVVVLLIMFSTASAQVLTPVGTVVSGGSGSTGTIQVSWSVGYPFNTSYTKSNLTVTEGMQQPSLSPRPPKIESFSPVRAGNGATVIITGNNFTSATSVKFGGIPASSFTVINGTKISAVVGSGASGYVSVATPLGVDSLPGFSYCNSVVPSISISASNTSICNITVVTFVAKTVNGGNSPTLQWKKNGVPIAGANDSVYKTQSLANNDSISCSMTTSLDCPTLPTVSSNVLPISLTTACPVDSSSGHLAGSFSVTDGGASNYSLPFVVSPGSSGMQPNIGLNYSSQGNNGIVGIGWSISGFSMIARSSQTLAQDGNLTGINFSQSDRFSLDGERLVTVNSSDSYGADGVEYSTEHKNFSKIISYGTLYYLNKTAPSYFKVFTKSGMIMEYGNTLNSKIRINGSTPLFYLLNKVSDTKGNYYTFTYLVNDSTGEYYPDKIQYTGNAVANQLPYSSIVFNYESRPDSLERFLGGLKIVSCTKRVQSINNFYKDSLVRSYRLNYNTTPNKLSELVSVMECGTDGVCHPPTTFLWENISQPSYTGKELTLTGGLKDNFASIDLDGDGVSEIIKIPESGSIQIYSSNEDTSNLDYNINRPSTNIVMTTNTKMLFGDFNADGRIDILTYNNSSSVIYINTTVTSSSQWSWSFGVTNNPINIYTPLLKIQILDFTGDGRSDILCYSPDGSNHLYISNTSGSALSFSMFGATPYLVNKVPPALLAGTEQKITFADMNVDGITDVIFYKKSTGKINLAINHGPAGNYTFTDHLLFSVNPSSSTYRSDVYIEDMNSDGVSDLVVKNDSIRSVKILLNRGDLTFVDRINFVSQDIGSSQMPPVLYFNDVNADGYKDILYYKSVGRDGGGVDLKMYVNDGRMTFSEFLELQLGGYDLSLESIGNFNSISNINLFTTSWLHDPVGRPVFLGNTRILHLLTPPLTYNNLVRRIAEGNGKIHDIKYEYLTNDSIYTKSDAGFLYPMMNYQASQLVVANYQTDDGIGGKMGSSYRYVGAKVQVDGRGFRGFSEVHTINDLTGIIQKKYFRNDVESWKYGSPPMYRNTTSLSNGTVISTTDIEHAAVSYTNGKSYSSFIKKSRSANYEINGAFVDSSVITQSVDRFGNVVTSTTDYGGGLKDSLVNTYVNDSTRWIIGRLTRSKLYRFAHTGSLIRGSGFEYDTGTGLLTREISEPDSSNTVRLEKTYSYDVFGNITSSNITGWNGTAFETKSTLTTYDPLGRFDVSTTNPIGQISYRKYEPLLCKVVEEIDVNSHKTLHEYDRYGREVKTIFPDGNWKRHHYRRANNTSTYVHSIEVESSSEPRVIKYYDLLDREVRQQTLGLKGAVIFQDTKHNNLGVVVEKSDPYFQDSIPNKTVFRYDVMGRQVAILSPGNRLDSVFYNGKTTIHINALQQRKTIKKDSKDQVISVRDNQNAEITFTYNAAGKLIKSTDPNGNNIIFEYDVYGNKTKMADPDLGTYTYVNNSFGQLIKQTDPMSNVVTMKYDILGRLVTRVEPEGTSIWNYDIQPFGKALLASIQGPHGYSKTFVYDSLSRLKQEIQIIDSSRYEQEYDYNGKGHLAGIRYPSGFAVNYSYDDSSGLLTHAKDHLTKKVYWTLGKLDAKGHMVQQIFGNGLQVNTVYDHHTNRIRNINTKANNTFIQNLQFDYDDLGNLMSRRDNLQGKEEAFAYDALNRLVYSKVEGYDSVTVQYDVIGNILHKSDVGFYQYGTTNNYPHRLVAVQKTTNICIPSFEVGTEYYSFNKVKKLYNASAYLNIVYNPDRQRIVQKFYTDSTLKRTKVYVSSNFEKEILNGDTVVTNHIIINGRTVASFSVHSNQSPAELYYFHRDHIGSVQMVTNDSGIVTGLYSFDPWGKRRNSDWSSIKTDSSLLPRDRGFTGHEHYELFDIVDMNGRVYDPVLGRFLSPDIIIQDPSDLQNYNRYSYVINNPLKYTDPSGFSFWDDLGDFLGDVVDAIGDAISAVVDVVAAAGKWVGENWRTIATVAVAIGVGILTGGSGLTLLGAIGSGAATGFATSVTSTLLAGGNIGDALRAGIRGAVIGGISAGLSFGVGEIFEHTTSLGNLAPKVISHGVVQGGVNVIQGGKFIHGFYSGALTPAGSFGISQIQSNVLRVTSAAVLGGTVSELTGGKFANGAISAAFVQMYNEDAFKKEYEESVKRQQEVNAKAQRSIERDNYWDGIGSGGNPYRAMETSKLLHRAITEPSFRESLLPRRVPTPTPTPSPSPSPFQIRLD
jgi:RHS repeat-associated protein